MKRIGISRLCDLPDWMDTVIGDLCTREEPITVEEAQELGT
jgi:hypothetical protein